ncbi:MAG: replication protein RepA [Sumerlaeia bacterium]
MITRRTNKNFKSLGELIEADEGPVGRFARMKASEAKFIGKAVRIQQYDVLEDHALGFSARVMAQAGLPHSDPGDDCDLWVCTNGHFCFSVQSKRYHKNGQMVNVGLPYGSLARLILYHIATQATQRRSPEIDLGTSLSSFMRRLGLAPTGGQKGNINRFKEQLRRITTSRFDFTYDNRDANGVGETRDQMFSIADSVHLWWDPKDPETDTFPSSMVLSDRFYRHIIESPVPVDMRAIDAIKKSPLALDLYTWLTARVFHVRYETPIPWALIYKQMGSEYADQKDFVKACKKYLARISHFWPELNYRYVRGRFILMKSEPHVPPKDQRLLF